MIENERMKVLVLPASMIADEGIPVHDLIFFCHRITSSGTIKSLDRMVHTPFKDHFLILFFQPHFIIIHGLVMVSEVHPRPPDEVRINERVGGIKIGRLDFGHI